MKLNSDSDLTVTPYELIGNDKKQIITFSWGEYIAERQNKTPPCYTIGKKNYEKKNQFGHISYHNNALLSWKLLKTFIKMNLLDSYFNK